MGTLPHRHLSEVNQDLVLSLFESRSEGHAVRALVMEVMLVMQALAVRPQVRRAMVGQEKGHLLCLGAPHLGVGPGPQVVTGGMEGREVNEVILQAAGVLPSAGLIADGEGRSHSCGGWVIPECSW